MLNRLALLLCANVLFFSVAMAGGKGDPVLYGVNIDQLEVRDINGDNGLYLDAKAWMGTDSHKVLIKAEIERTHGLTNESEWQLLYGVPIATYWDIQVGLRQDFKPSPSRTWAMVNVEGLAPNFIDFEASLFVGESGRTGFRVQAEYDIVLTQQWSLKPEIEVNFSGQNDEAVDVGSGLTETEFRLLLSYEVNRNFSPYVGINWSKKYGETANYVKEEGEDDSETVFVLGFSAWF